MFSVVCVYLSTLESDMTIIHDVLYLTIQGPASPGLLLKPWDITTLWRDCRPVQTCLLKNPSHYFALGIIVTAHKWSLGQGNDLFIFVCSQGVCIYRGSAYRRSLALEGFAFRGEGLPTEGEFGRPPWPEKRAACILLKCFPVWYYFCCNLK